MTQFDCGQGKNCNAAGTGLVKITGIEERGEEGDRNLAICSNNWIFNRYLNTSRDKGNLSYT